MKNYLLIIIKTITGVSCIVMNKDYAESLFIIENYKRRYRYIQFEWFEMYETAQRKAESIRKEFEIQ